MTRLLLIVLVALTVVGSRASTFDEPQDVVVRARERAEHASPKGEAKAQVELVRALVDRAATEYTAEKYDDSTKLLNEATDAVTKARASAEENKHDLKHCELMLAMVERRLTDMDRSFASQDRAPLEMLLKQVQQTRDKLVELVFQTQ